MTNENFYITTAIPYVNAAPHIGHALEFVQTDVIRRFYDILGYKTFLLTGADENSLKNVRAAEALKIGTQELCDRNSLLFRQLAEKINLKYDIFFRSSNKDKHWPGAQEIWKRCVDSGDIYKKEYEGLYCVGCEGFYTKDELVDGLCPEHKTKPEEVKEVNYFFRLSKYQDALLQLIESGKLAIFPESRKNEVLSFIKGGLEDFSASRSAERAHGWGVPVPGDPSQIQYVWIDALTTYINGIGFGTDMEQFKKWWPAQLHVIGKGITRFHAIYWPAILMSAKVELPKAIFAHGYLTVNGEKMSKTIGNVINPLDVLEKYSADELRYYLIRDMPSFEDGDFSIQALKDRANKELLGEIGNLVSRVLTMAERSGLQKYEGDNVLEKKLELEKIKTTLSKMELHETLEAVLSFVKECNRYINEEAPWKLSGKPLETALYNLLEGIRVLSILLYPFIPDTAGKMADKLGTKMGCIEDCTFRGKFEGKVVKGAHLFEKLE